MSTGIVLSHLTFALVLFLLLPTSRLPLTGRITAFGAVALLSLVHVDGLSLAEYLRSVTNGLSISSLLWLAWGAGARIGGRVAMAERQRLQLALCFSILALVLYPASLGLSTFDPYRLGYAPGLLLLAVFAASVILWLLRHYFGAALLTGVSGVYLLDFRSPDNYWDYLLDPLLGLYCLLVLGWFFSRRLGRRLKERFAWDPLPGARHSVGESRLFVSRLRYSSKQDKGLEVRDLEQI